MGRRFKKKSFAQKKRERKSNGDEPVKKQRPDRRSEPFHEIIRHNDAFIRYYQHANICKENEWDAFLSALKADLPTTFRIAGCRGEAKKLLHIMKNEFFNMYIANREQEAAEEHTESKRPFNLPWYPNELGWQLELTRKDIRRSEAYYKLHNFLIAETQAGSISRQEAVSMIPPLVLDVKPHHKVLDMCAAPGSKTAQLIEALHADENIPIPTGFVVANDVDNNRCYMLVHQTKRLNSPCFIITNHDSSVLPQIKTNEGKPIKFDRVLCDVPCSGDGTLRKNPDIWMKWSPGHGLNLHGVQYRIARRGAELLEIGGRLVYSTCSLNPVENEAVLHRLIKDADGALELVDGSEFVPGLKYLPGLSNWDVAVRECNEFYSSFDQVPEEYHTMVRPQMFPPSKEDAPSFQLNKSMRVLPHYQNTGGFFIAALTKKKLMPWERKEKEEEATKATEKQIENTENAEAEQKGQEKEPQRKKRKIFGYKEDPYVFFTEGEPVWQGIKPFYQIDLSSESKGFKPTNLLTRSNVGKKKNIYFCSEAVKHVVQANEQNIKIINTGVKAFARCDNRNMSCEFRLANEGLPSISSIIGNSRRIEITRDDAIVLLNHVDPKHPPELEKLSDATQKRIQEIEPGSCLIVYNEPENDFSLKIVGWRGSRTVRAYVDMNDSVHMLRLLGADVSKFEVNKFEKKREEENGQNGATEEKEIDDAGNAELKEQDEVMIIE